MKKLFGILLLLFLIGCTRNKDTMVESIESEKNHEPIELYYRESNKIFFEQIVKEYKKSHPDMNINQHSITNDPYYEEICAQLASGGKIDVFDSGNITEYAFYVDQGYVRNIDDLIKRDAINIVAYGPLVNEITMEGKRYGLPFITSTWVLFYNKDLFDKSGVDYPEDDMTWSQFRRLASSLTRDEAGNKVYGAYLHKWPQCWYGKALQTGASIIDVDLSPFTSALQYRINLENDGSIMPRQLILEEDKHYRQVFIDEEAAMVPMGEWMIEHLRTAEAEGQFTADWDIVPMPHPEDVDPNITWGMSAQLLINKKSTVQDEAWDFIKFAGGEEGAEIFASYGRLPAYQNASIKELFTSQGKKPRNIDIIFNQKVYMEMPAVRNTYYYNEFIHEESDKALRGQCSAEEAILNIKRRINEKK